MATGKTATTFVDLTAYLGNARRLTADVTSRYDLGPATPQREAVKHFAQSLSRLRHAESLYHIVYLAFHYLHAISETQLNEQKTRQARREWQSAGMRELTKRGQATVAEDLRERFQKSQERGEWLDRKKESIAEIVLLLAGRHAAKKTKVSAEHAARAEAAVASPDWAKDFELIYAKLLRSLGELDDWESEFAAINDQWSRMADPGRREALLAAFAQAIDEARAKLADAEEREGNSTGSMRGRAAAEATHARNRLELLIREYEALQAGGDLLDMEARKLEAFVSSASAAAIADDELAERMGALQDKVDALSQKESAVEGELETLLGEKTELEEKLDTTRAEAEVAVSKLRTERDGLEARVKELAEARDGLEKQRAELEKAKAELEFSRKALEQEKSLLAGEVDDLKTETEKLSSTKGGLEGELEKLLSEKADEDAALETAVTARAAVEAERETLRNELAERDKRIAAIEAERDRKLIEFEAARDEALHREKVLDARLGAINADVAARGEEATTAERARMTAEMRLTEMQAALDAATSARSVSEQKFHAVQSAYADSMRRVEEATRTIEGLEITASEQGSELQTLQEGKAALTQRADRAEAGHAMITTEMEVIARRAMELERNIKEEQMRLSSSLSGLSAAKRELSAAEDERDKQARKAQALSGELEQLLAAQTGLQQQTEQATGELERAKAAATAAAGDAERLRGELNSAAARIASQDKALADAAEAARGERDQFNAEIQRLREKISKFDRERESLKERLEHAEEQKKLLLTALNRSDDDRKHEQTDMLDQIEHLKRESAARQQQNVELASRLAAVQARVDDAISRGIARDREMLELRRRLAEIEALAAEVAGLRQHSDSASGSERDELLRETSERLEHLLAAASASMAGAGV